MELGEKIWYLSKFDLLEEFSPAEIKSVAKVCHHGEFARGEVLALPGQPVDQVYFLMSGHLNFSRLREDGSRVILYLLGPGEIFGELMVVDHPPAQDFVEAVDSGALCSITKKEFHRLLKRKPDLAFRVIKEVGKKVVTLERRIEDLVGRPILARLAATLLYLARDYGRRECPKGLDLDLTITQEELAQLVGASRQRVSTLLTEMVEEGLIHYHGRRLCLLDPGRLEAMI